MFKALKGKMLIQAILFTSIILLGVNAPALSNTSGINLIVNFTGDVKVKKDGWSQWQKADFGNTLSPNDQLEVGTNSSVTIYCSDLSESTVEQPGTYWLYDGCSPGEATLKLPNSNNETRRPGGIREQALKNIPYIISPRNTSILNNQPTIRWNAVPGATSYQVTVEDWEAEARNTEIPYTGELEAEFFYFVSVVADNGSSSEEEAEVGFTVLDEQNEKDTLVHIKAVKQQGLTKEAEGLVLAHLYRGNDLNAKAIQLLEELVQQGSKQVSVYQLLGDIYQQVGLSLQAKATYSQGLVLAKNVENVAGQASIQAELGEVEYALGNEDEAIDWLEKAKADYLVLGDEFHIKKMEQRISSILGKG